MFTTPSFWRGKNILLTGHTGFKGSWLSTILLRLGANVFGYSLEVGPENRMFKDLELSSEIESEFGDVRDFGALSKFMARVKPDIVFHLAAQPLVRDSYTRPQVTFETNAMGTVNLLESVRSSSSVRAVLNVTTDKCYENQESIWGFRESDALGGHDPYSSSKACSEIITASYRKSFFSAASHCGVRNIPRVASARAGNVIGGGDYSKDRLIPDIIRSFSNGKAVELRNPEAVRPWQHVLEAVGGYMLLIEKLYCGDPVDQAWNSGPNDDDCKSVEWITDYICRTYYNSPSWTLSKDMHPHEAGFLRLDSAKAKNYLNWKPVLPISRALDLTVQWFLEVEAGGSPRAITEEQIDVYFSEVNGAG